MLLSLELLDSDARIPEQGESGMAAKVEKVRTPKRESYPVPAAPFMMAPCVVEVACSGVAPPPPLPFW